ncbi:MAG: prefoldin subunit [archaeon]|nr:prefoldin subunit [archaeon]
MEECFDGTIKVSIGEIFVVADESQAKSHVEKMRKKYKDENDGYKAHIKSNEKRLDELKIILYSKFGDRLRLEEDE